MRLKSLRINWHNLPFFVVLLMLAALAGGCKPVSSSQPTVSASEMSRATTTHLPATVVLDPVARIQSSLTPALVPSATFTPSFTPTTTLTPTITPTLNPEPMSIEAGRQRAYPGSDIVIDRELNPGSNYHCYYAWYLSDGHKIYGLLTVPFGTMPEGGWPAILFNHGFIPPYLYSTTASYFAHVDSLASQGYVVFKIDYRGNNWSEGPETYVYGEPGYTNDVLNALASLERFPQVNPQKIGMWGHSMGGYLTLRAMVISKGIKVGVIWAGVVGSYTDMICCWYAHPMVFPTPLVGSHTGWQTWVQEHGTPDQNPQFWDSISATSYLADLSGPLQLHHELYDYEVPYAFSESLAAGIQAAGKTVAFYSYPGSDHNLANIYTLAMTRTIQFFDRYLK